MAKEQIPPVATSGSKRVSPMWIVPLVAAILAAALFIDYRRKSGPLITIVFQEGTGLKIGQTALNYRGVKVGLVETVALGKELDHVEVKVRLDASASGLAREGSVFWIVRPQLGAGGIRGIEALASGAYIQVKPGTGKKHRRFRGWEKMPLTPTAEGGLTVVLKTDDAGGLNQGAPLYYRGFQVGFISDLHLAADAQAINVDTHINAAYVPLVRQNTHFWKAGGLDIDVSLFGGADIRLQSLRSLVSGGITLSTPDELGKPAPSGAIFQLHEKPEDEWLEWSPAIELGMYQ